MSLYIQKLNKDDLIKNYYFYNAYIAKEFRGFDMKKLNRDKKYEYFIIAYNDNFLGFFMIYDKERLQKFYILPLFRSIGLGSLLVKEFKISYPNLHFFVKMNNKDAIRFYERNGFKIVKKMPKFKIVKMNLIY